MSIFAIHCLIDPANGVVRPCRPNGSVYQTFGPSLFETRLRRADGKAILEKIRRAREALARQLNITKDISETLH